jgi:hypothetical protein
VDVVTDLAEAYREFAQAARLAELHWNLYWFGGGWPEKERYRAAMAKRGLALRRYQQLELSYGSPTALSPFTPAAELSRLRILRSEVS